jgi:3-hydroxyacyl-CoA dehydrogenase/enoyl-CoA hydratase/3-hydroxybutyryl-CoA epimerase
MLTGPMPAARKALAKAGLTVDQIDLFEVNEAFAAVPMRFMKEMGVPHEKVNVNGGAIAMGHPLGATGAMILNTLIDELHRRKLRYGLATLCVGGGMGIATIVERSEAMKTIRYELADGIATLTFDEPGSPVNTMCLQWQDDLSEVAAAGAAGQGRDPRHRAGLRQEHLLRRRRPQGHDAPDAADAPACSARSSSVKKNFRTLETLGKPVVACLNGTALGGGWEVALVGALPRGRRQPEDPVRPAGGHAGPDPRRLRHHQDDAPAGPDGRAALHPGRQAVQPARGAGAGPGARTGGRRAACAPAALAWIAANPQAQQPWDAKDYKMPGGTPEPTRRSPAALAVAPAMLKQKTRGLYPAPEAALAAMVEGAQVDFDTALRIESRYLARLIVSPVAKNMINTFFFNMNAIKAASRGRRGEGRFKPQKVGILGAGMMGAGIAYAQASRGIATVLKDVSAGQGRGRQGLQREAHAAARRERPHERRTTRRPCSRASRHRIQAKDLQGCDLIIEAVFENRELKAKVTQEAEPLLAPGGFFASNTSTLPISGLAKASARPEKFVGIHFFSPVDKMKLVEIIRGKQTDDETVARAFDYVQALGKIPIVVNDARGFFTSRVFGTFVMEGAAMLGEGIPAAGGRTGRHAGRHAGGPAGGAGRNRAVAVGARAGPDPRRLPRRRPHLHRDARASCWSSAWSRSSTATAARPAAASTTTRRKRREEVPVARTQALFEQAGACLGHAGPEGPPALPPGGGDRALPGRRRADQRARRQHRLDLRHRLSGLDRRRDAVHLRHGERRRAGLCDHAHPRHHSRKNPERDGSPCAAQASGPARRDRQRLRLPGERRGELCEWSGD